MCELVESMRTYTPVLGAEICRTCRFFVRSEESRSVGECRIGRPAMGEATRVAVWPLVQDRAFCGEYERRFIAAEPASCPAAAQSAA